MFLAEKYNVGCNLPLSFKHTEIYQTNSLIQGKRWKKRLQKYNNQKQT